MPQGCFREGSRYRWPAPGGAAMRNIFFFIFVLLGFHVSDVCCGRGLCYGRPCGVLHARRWLACLLLRSCCFPGGVRRGFPQIGKSIGFALNFKAG